MKKIMQPLYLTFALSAVMVFTNCGQKVAGNTSETGNGVVTGMIYEPDGKTPAAHAKVSVRPRNTLADTAGFALGKRMADTASVITDNTGRFAFDTTLDTGTYVIEVASGNDAVFIDSVVVTNKSIVDSLPPDTLKPAGAIKGVVRLSEGGDPRKVFVLAFGIDRFTRVEADGSFRFSGLAEGKYDLRLISSLDDYGVLDTVNIPVKSGDTLNMGTIDLPFTGIPTPKNVTIAYDTLKNIIALSWSKPDSLLVKGFNVYRRNVDSNTVLARINTSPITDTLYRDSTGIQDHTYEYRVAAVDKNATEGVKSAGVGVKVVVAYELVRTINNIPAASGPINSIIIVNDSVYVCGVSGEIEMLDTAGNIVRVIGKQGSDSLIAPTAFTIHENTMYITDLEVYNSSGTGSRHIQTSIKCFDLSGNFIKKILFPLQLVINGIVVISESEIFIIGRAFDSYSRMFRINSVGEVLDSTSIISPNSARVLLNDSMLVINRSWFDSGQIIWFNFDMDSIGSKTVKGQGASTSFQNMAFDGNDNLYAAVNDAVSQSRPAHYINVFDARGDLLTWISCENNIGGIAVDSRRLVYVGVGTKILVYKNRVGSLERLLSSD